MEKAKTKSPLKKCKEFEEDTTDDVADAAAAAAPTQQEQNGHIQTTSKDREGDEPQMKLARLEQSTNTVNLSLNSAYQQKDFIKWLRNAWFAKENKTIDAKEEKTGAQIFRTPFQIGLLPELLDPKSGACKALVDEMINKVHWSRKQMDLYEFYQSTDLSNMSECRLLTNFLQLLRRQVRPWLEQAIGIKLDYASASCSMYTCGDYLLVHDDLLKDRQIAFVYYLSPWEGAEEWTEEQGGCLEIFNSDEQCFPLFPVHRKISPKNNQFVFFKVGARSFHQVGEVTNFDYPRLTINGWFHGETNKEHSADPANPFTRLQFKQPNVTTETSALELLLNEVYLKPATRKSIQKSIENNSEICLYEFLRSEIFEKALKQLLEDDKLIWRRHGPANAHNYEVLELKSASETIEQLLNLFASNDMFELLYHYTDLDLFGSDAITPTCSVELQRWSHGNYTVLSDGAINEDNTLDLIYYLNASDGAAVITYLSPEAEEEPVKHNLTDDDANDDDCDDDDDDSVLLTISPVDNALNIVYRCEGTTKFTKYVSRNTPLDRGPVFVISCSYKE